ncbi:hypothetical protein BDZ94DRAFT_1271446 [Collybia nuda]|uniref:Uncharacterized protein n=1 Tax=Collybia nuda TaxID=64659 RepID=A0A9P6CEL6_9AGAR|nr:hypothetical protein BDZ94DRAFT_1271446 [Collybia nuda]
MNNLDVRNYKEAVALYKHTEDDREAARNTMTAAISQLRVAATNLKEAQDQLTEADLQSGRVRYYLRERGFADVFSARSSRVAVAALNQTCYVVARTGEQTFYVYLD